MMDLTQISEATEIQKEQGLVEWARAFNAGSWEEVNQIDGPIMIIARALYNGPLVKTISEKNFVNWLSVEIRLPPWYPYSAATEDRATVRTDLSAAPAET